MEVIFLDCLLCSPLMTENLNAPSYHGAKGRINPGQAASSSQYWHRELDNNTNTHINTDNLSSPLHLTCISLDCGRNLELPARKAQEESLCEDWF